MRSNPSSLLSSYLLAFALASTSGCETSDSQAFLEGSSGKVDTVGDTSTTTGSLVALLTIPVACERGSATETRTCSAFGCGLWSTASSSSSRGTDQITMACEQRVDETVSCIAHSSGCVVDEDALPSWWLSGALTEGTPGGDGSFVLAAAPVQPPYVSQFTVGGAADEEISVSSLLWSTSYTTPVKVTSTPTSTKHSRTSYWQQMTPTALPVPAPLIPAWIEIVAGSTGPATDVYAVAQEASAFSDSQSICDTLGAEVAQGAGLSFPGTEVGATFDDSEGLWIDAAREADGEFRFASGRSMSESMWAPGEPSDAGDCVIASAGEFFAVPCDELHQTLCHKSLLLNF